MRNFTVANGTNHEIVLYTNPQDYVRDRKGSYSLRNKRTNNYVTFRKETPLNVTVTPNRPVTSYLHGNSYPIFYPDAAHATLDSLGGYNNYDMIIVSSFYASYAISYFSAYPDYLDRLYTPVTLYDETGETIVGCVGFKKVSCLLSPSYYVDALTKGLSPSIASISECIHSNYPSSRFSDPVNQQALRSLIQFING